VGSISGNSGNKKLSAQWIFDPDGARARVIFEFKRNGFDMRKTAIALGVARGTLYRWLEERPSLKILMDRAEFEAREARKGVRA
jgi:hypothetical protein